MWTLFKAINDAGYNMFLSGQKKKKRVKGLIPDIVQKNIPL